MMSAGCFPGSPIVKAECAKRALDEAGRTPIQALFAGAVFQVRVRASPPKIVCGVGSNREERGRESL